MMQMIECHLWQGIWGAIVHHWPSQTTAPLRLLDPVQARPGDCGSRSSWPVLVLRITSAKILPSRTCTSRLPALLNLWWTCNSIWWSFFRMYLCLYLCLSVLSRFVWSTCKGRHKNIYAPEFGCCPNNNCKKTVLILCCIWISILIVFSDPAELAVYLYFHWYFWFPSNLTKVCCSLFTLWWIDSM